MCSAEKNLVIWDTPYYEQDLSLIVLRLAHEIVQHENASLAKCGLTCSKSNTVAFLWHNRDKTINQKAIATYFGVKGSSVTSILNSMEKQGLITRTKNPGDSRNNIVALSEEGLALNTVLQGQVRYLEEKMLKGMDDDERRAFMNSLLKVVKNFEDAQAT